MSLRVAPLAAILHSGPRGGYWLNFGPTCFRARTQYSAAWSRAPGITGASCQATPAFWSASGRRFRQCAGEPRCRLDGAVLRRPSGRADSSADAHRTLRGAECSGPVYQLVVVARVQVSGVVGDLIDPAQPAGRLVGYRIAARDEAQCYGRIPLRVCRTPAGLCVHGVIPEPVGQPSPRLERQGRPRRRGEFLVGRIPHRMIAGKARRRLISASREARSRVNRASSHGSASR